MYVRNEPSFVLTSQQPFLPLLRIHIPQVALSLWKKCARNGENPFSGGGGLPYDLYQVASFRVVSRHHWDRAVGSPSAPLPYLPRPPLPSRALPFLRQPSSDPPPLPRLYSLPRLGWS